MAGDRERYLPAGMDDYLAKPYTIDDLRKMLEKWIGRNCRFYRRRGEEEKRRRGEEEYASGWIPNRFAAIFSQRLSRSLSEIDSVSWLGLVRHLRRWQIGRIALLSAHFAALDLPHDPFAILGHLSPTDS